MEKEVMRFKLKEFPTSVNWTWHRGNYIKGTIEFESFGEAEVDPDAFLIEEDGKRVPKEGSYDIIVVYREE